MSKASQNEELRPEYDFAKMKGGVRGKYAESYREGTNLALLQPDIAEAFPTDESVNEALRSYIRLAKTDAEVEGPPNQPDSADAEARLSPPRPRR